MAEVEFEPTEALNSFLRSEMLRPTNMHHSDTVTLYLAVLESEKSNSILEILFWIVHLINFFPEETKNIAALRHKLSAHYKDFFPDLPDPKSEILTLLQFTYGYIIHGFHYRLFPDNRVLYNTRFILDCYHIVIYILTGVFVSDYFIHGTLEKYFGDKFFSFQQSHWGKIVEEDDIGGGLGNEAGINEKNF